MIECRPSGAQEAFRHRFMGYVLSVTAFPCPWAFLELRYAGVGDRENPAGIGIRT